MGSPCKGGYSAEGAGQVAATALGEPGRDKRQAWDSGRHGTAQIPALPEGRGLPAEGVPSSKHSQETRSPRGKTMWGKEDSLSSFMDNAGFEVLRVAGTVPLWKSKYLMFCVSCTVIPWGRAWVLSGDTCSSGRARPRGNVGISHRTSLKELEWKNMGDVFTSPHESAREVCPE